MCPQRNRTLASDHVGVCPLVSTRMRCFTMVSVGSLAKSCPLNRLRAGHQTDLKSLDGNVVWVRVPPPAPPIPLSKQGVPGSNCNTLAQKRSDFVARVRPG